MGVFCNACYVVHDALSPSKVGHDSECKSPFRCLTDDPVTENRRRTVGERLEKRWLKSSMMKGVVYLMSICGIVIR